MLLDTKELRAIVKAALKGWKRGRVKRALKQLKRNEAQLHFNEQGGISLFCAGQIEWATAHDADDEPGADDPTAIVTGEAAPPEVFREYNGDVAGLIRELIQAGELEESQKVHQLLKYLRKNKREAAAASVTRLLGQCPDVTESCKLGALLEYLDAPRPGSAATDPVHAMGPQR